MVHNHGPDEGDGLDCPERRLSDGTLRGKCMDVRFENFPVKGRNGNRMGKVVGIDDEGRMHLVLDRETSETVRVYVEEGLIDSLTLYLLTMAAAPKKPPSLT